MSVGWLTTGGLWVAELDTRLRRLDEDDDLVHSDPVRLILAYTMDERREILREHFDASFMKM